jgi:hypothetical protein
MSKNVRIKILVALYGVLTLSLFPILNVFVSCTMYIMILNQNCMQQRWMFRSHTRIQVSLLPQFSVPEYYSRLADNIYHRLYFIFTVPEILSQLNDVELWIVLY